ncbi:hypothetical protein ARALYDRAFT_355758 [Arabidopsis lyrata subsp. lyrata]|uniref:HMA domain-containing protein n=1 Tax=Arabidopsis lyrata subsp. lyrata TaxID=81972 RepID=D7MIM1_ARALL|nr:hypothetical protein ARALYDRAFT_355758 [Arabidopsis lyrata subsp. lyrata]
MGLGSFISTITYCLFLRYPHKKPKHKSHLNYYHTMPRARPLSLQTIDLTVRMCCSGCERVVKHAIYKLRGVDSVEVNLEMERVTVVGYVERKKVLKAVRRADTTRKFRESYNYYRHGYNLSDRHGHIHVTNRGDDKVSNFFNDDNVHACRLM